jgi:hypothetical protein
MIPSLEVGVGAVTAPRFIVDDDGTVEDRGYLLAVRVSRFTACALETVTVVRFMVDGGLLKQAWPVPAAFLRECPCQPADESLTRGEQSRGSGPWRDEMTAPSHDAEQGALRGHKTMTDAQLRANRANAKLGGVKTAAESDQ